MKNVTIASTSSVKDNNVFCKKIHKIIPNDAKYFSLLGMIFNLVQNCVIYVLNEKSNVLFYVYNYIISMYLCI